VCVEVLNSILSGYLKSCREIVSCARTIANTITNSIPELYVLGSPPASVVAFASKSPELNIHEVGDAMSKRGWHLNALSGPAAVHIACTVGFPTLFSLGHGGLIIVPERSLRSRMLIRSSPISKTQCEKPS
jgi:hypothetical protein